MKRFAPDFPDDPDVTHPFAVELLVRVALVAAVPVALWVLAEPVTAILTVTVLALGGVLLVGTLAVSDEEDADRSD